MSEKVKILLVEDEFILYQELCEFFEEKGYEIVREDEDRAVDNYDDAVKLMKQHKPHIAILDIIIKGTKDGIELGDYIKKQYRIPVIYISSHNNTGNLERIRNSGDERFVLKADKPLNKDQLWTIFYLALPKINRPPAPGMFFSVKEMIVTQENNRQRILAKTPGEPLEIETFFKWKDIVFIESYNSKTAGSGNNNILIHTTTPGKAYMMRSSLVLLENQLPEYFGRFDQSTVLNILRITGHIKSGSQYLIGDLAFKLSDTYKEKTLEKIDRFLYGAGAGTEDFPD